MKKKYVICFVIVLFLNIRVVHAKSLLSCTKEVLQNENIECKVTVDDEGVTVMSDGNINILDLNGEKYSKLNSTKAVFYESGTVIFGPASNDFSSYTIFLYTVDGSREYAPSIKINVIPRTTTKKTTTTTKKKSTNNYLSFIKVNNEDVANFSKTTTRYYLTLPYENEKTKIEFETEDKLSKAEINGPDFLEVGDNEYTIGVTSEDNTTRYYKILITRLPKEKEASSNTKLKDISIKGYDFDFNNTSKTFHLKINENTNKLNMEVLLDDETSTYVVQDNENLTDGSIISVVVTAENGKKDTYRIIINKEKKEDINLIIIGVSIALIPIITAIILIVLRIRKKKNNTSNSKINENLEKTIIVSNIDNASNADENLEKTIKIDNLNTNEKEEK